MQRMYSYSPAPRHLVVRGRGLWCAGSRQQTVVLVGGPVTQCDRGDGRVDLSTMTACKVCGGGNIIKNQRTTKYETVKCKEIRRREGKG